MIIVNSNSPKVSAAAPEPPPKNTASAGFMDAPSSTTTSLWLDSVPLRPFQGRVLQAHRSSCTGGQSRSQPWVPYRAVTASAERYSVLVQSQVRSPTLRSR